jgi:hypothetical protein
MKRTIPKNKEYFVGKVKELAKISVLADGYKMSPKDYILIETPELLEELETYGIVNENLIHEDFREAYIEERTRIKMTNQSKEVFYKNFFTTFVVCWLFIASFVVLWFGVSYFIVNDWLGYIKEVTVKMSYLLPTCAIITAMGTMVYAWEMFYNLNKWNENNGE